MKKELKKYIKDYWELKKEIPTELDSGFFILNFSSLISNLASMALTFKNSLIDVLVFQMRKISLEITNDLSDKKDKIKKNPNTIEEVIEHLRLIEQYEDNRIGIIAIHEPSLVKLSKRLDVLNEC